MVTGTMGARAEVELGEPAPTPVLGIAETRFGRPRWTRDAGTGEWVRSDPWQTGFVDPAGGQGILGQVAILSTSAAAADPRRAATRADRGRPHSHGRPGQQDRHRHPPVHHPRSARTAGPKEGPGVGPTDPLLSGRERLTDAQFAGMWNQLLDGDESGQILTAWIVKEYLRTLLHVAHHGEYRRDLASAVALLRLVRHQLRAGDPRPLPRPSRLGGRRSSGTSAWRHQRRHRRRQPPGQQVKRAACGSATNATTATEYGCTAHDQTTSTSENQASARLTLKSHQWLFRKLVDGRRQLAHQSEG